MTWIATATSLVAQSEGCRLTAYPDPATGDAPWTIGYGATGYGIAKGTVWTQAQADVDLQSRLALLGTQVDACTRVKLNDNQKAALVSFAYNLGIGALRTSTLIALVSASRFGDAAAEFGKWVRAAGAIMPGLVVRRAREAILFLS